MTRSSSGMTSLVWWWLVRLPRLHRAIARSTFTQCIRQPIYGVLLGITFAVLVLSLPLSGWTMGVQGGDYAETDQMMLENVGLGTLLIIPGVAIASFSAVGAFRREIDSRTALTVLAKPVPRFAFVAGKMIGVMAAVTVAYYLSALALFMLVRHQVVSAAFSPIDWPVIVLGLTALGVSVLIGAAGNLFFNWSFIASSVWSMVITFTLAIGILMIVDKGWTAVDEIGVSTKGKAMIRPDLIWGTLLIYLGVLVLTATAVAASTRFSTAVTLLIVFAVFLVGSYHPALFTARNRGIPVVWLLGVLLPRLTYFYPLDALASQKTIPPIYVLLALGYCLGYVVALTALAVAVFQRRPLEVETSRGQTSGTAYLLSQAGRWVSVALVLVGAAILVNALGLLLWPVAMAVLPGVAEPSGPLFAAERRLTDWPAWVEILTGLALVPLGLASRTLWGYFARGSRWSYWAVASLLVALVALAIANWLGGLGLLESLDWVFARPVVLLVVSLAGLIVLALPATRKHFRRSAVSG